MAETLYQDDDLISRKAAIDRIEAYCNGCDSYNGVRCRACQIADAMDAVDEVEAAPVRYGRWIKAKGKTNLWYCSECGEKILYNPNKRTYNVQKMPVFEKTSFVGTAGRKWRVKMGSKTKIDWCDSTWNPVTGCLHDCAYCYARKIAERFGGVNYEDELENRYGEYDVVCLHAEEDVHKLDRPIVDFYSGKKAPYPWEFDPTFHRYKLDEPQKWKKPRNIFVCSMADLFGEWVPDKWIEQVFKACEAAPQHRYLFLTKNPKRYADLYEKNILPIGERYWYGTTVTSSEQPFFYSHVPDDNPHTFVSIEPIMGSFGKIKNLPDWVIVGAETGNRKGKVVPQNEWIDEIATECRRCRVPIFMKESLREIMGDDFRQEFPWEVE